MIFEPVSQLTMDAITSLTLTFVIVCGCAWIILGELEKDAEHAFNRDYPLPRLTARTIAEKIIALLEGNRIEVIECAIEDAEIALATTHRVSANPLATTILEPLSLLDIGSAYEAIRIAAGEFQLRVWRAAA